ncbi:bacteriocin [Photobacterium damselae subsp. damselae]|uniref:Proteobacterial sortase system OmpA family protein n=1 Tax=Photobacterium damselae TaxID=38293 RepID=A0A2T3QLF9_PHODM|nr:hypothetical protein [Photobacterium damselae]PSW85830.1 bacteriocin [Photobacterium damselae]UKA27550.1 bacteriocin [Photobacterium damselae subsp. damselae]SPY44011.1 proteobacterial sortase system OmpA family protein [Photobacterium damselae]
MSYGLLSLGQDTRQQALNGLRNAANQEQEREQINQQLKNAQRTQTMGSIGSGVAIGAMAGGPVGALLGAGAGLILGELF